MRSSRSHARSIARARDLLCRPGSTGSTSGLVGAVAAYERLAAEAAVTGDRETAFLALLAHPLIGQIKPAEQLLNDILVENAAHLPRFRT
jgi:6-phospho-beta-glucosidase